MKSLFGRLRKALRGAVSVCGRCPRPDDATDGAARRSPKFGGTLLEDPSDALSRNATTALPYAQPHRRSRNQSHDEKAVTKGAANYEAALLSLVVVQSYSRESAKLLQRSNLRWRGSRSARAGFSAVFTLHSVTVNTSSSSWEAFGYSSEAAA